MRAVHARDDALHAGRAAFLSTLPPASGGQDEPGADEGGSSGSSGEEGAMGSGALPCDFEEEERKKNP
jgi:hypothetical protein